MKIKICGLTRENDIEACIDAGIDYLGFNLLKVSKRFVDILWTSKIIDKYKIASKSVILIDDQVWTNWAKTTFLVCRVGGWI